MRAVLLASRAALCTARLRARRGSASARARASPATAAHRAMHAASAASGAPATLNASLHAGRAALAGRGPLTLVLGNEAADMDSIACAVAFAALLRACGDDGAVAFVGVPREDLRLRAEVAWLLQRERVDVDAVVFADDAELGALRAAGRLRRVVLVDHNRPAGAVESAIGDAVAQIVDHHVDEGMYGTAVRDIQLVGSCSTLVAEHISREAPALLDDAALRTMLLGAVLLDTGNLTGISGRVTPQDKEAVKLLSRGASEEDIRVLFETLRFKRTDQSGLSTPDLLRRDYKEWMMNGWRVGVSAIGLPLAEVAARGSADSLDAALSRWRDARGLDFLLVMSAHGAGGVFQRELGTSARGEAAVELLPRLVAALTASQLTLEPLPLPPPGWPAPGGAFAQRDVKGSRKVVQPLLVQFFADNAKP